jgi:hypothetical protein
LWDKAGTKKDDSFPAQGEPLPARKEDEQQAQEFIERLSWIA